MVFYFKILLMAKKSSSKKWLNEHKNDEFVKRSIKEGYRSRAVYKLLEVVDKYKFIKLGDTVLDLGAAPGGWSQLAIKLVGDKGKVIASDILSMEDIPGVIFIKGDFTKDKIYQKILTVTNNNIDVLISDMAPNMSGIAYIDMPKAMYLSELSLDLANNVLKPNGYFFIKLFQGDTFQDFVKKCRDDFSKVIIKKPKASRSRSREVYLLARK